MYIQYVCKYVIENTVIECKIEKEKDAKIHPEWLIHSTDIN